MKVACKAGVYFRHDCWNHRYVKIRDDGRKEYGTKTGFSSNEEATLSYWNLLEEYNKKKAEITSKLESRKGDQNE